MKKTVTFGEIMLRLTTPENQRFLQAESFLAVYGGSEANVAVSLCNYGQPAEHVTALPQNAIGQAALNSLRRYGVATNHIARCGNRLGLYFVEKGAAYRKQGIVYDRALSAIATAPANTFNWQEIFNDADWFHFSGITPALSTDCAAMCLAACKAAHSLGLTVSCDLNYREALWPREKANRVMSELMPLVDVCFAYEDEPQDMFGITPQKGTDPNEGYRQMATELKKRFGFKLVAITNSRSYSAMQIDWAAMLYDGNDFYFSRRYEINAVDRIGGGDAFCGGFIYAAKNGYTPQQIIEFAVAAGSMKYTVMGDYNCVSAEEVAALAFGKEN